MEVKSQRSLTNILLFLLTFTSAPQRPSSFFVLANGENESCAPLLPPSASLGAHHGSNNGGAHYPHSAALQSSANGNSNNNNNNNNNNPSHSASHDTSPSWGETVVCQIRTLHGELDFDNITSPSVPTAIEWSLVTKLVLKCNDVLFFESSLSPEQFSPFKNLHELSIEKCKLKFLGSGVLGSLKHLRRLTINTENSDWASRSLELSPSLLDELGQLRHLNLGFNHMWNLPESLLCQVALLQSLNLTHNLLSDVEDLGLPPVKTSKLATTPPCLPELRSLDLSHNSLRSLGQSKFERLKKLAELHLHHNWLEELHDDSFKGLNQLRNLNLSSNRLVALPPKLFQNSKMLRELDLHNNSLTSLSSEVLQPLEQLLILDFSRNSLTTTDGEPFKGCVRLVILNLSQNQISTVNPSTFKDLYTLQVLDLSHNHISNFEPETFRSMSNLHALSLAKNHLRVISAHTFDGLYVLHKLILDYNEITVMDESSFKNCTSLQDLGLVGNALTNIPPALKSLHQLKTLDLGENRISILFNNSFQGLGQLYGLRLVDNQIQTLPRNLCEPLSRLRVFNVAQNQISKISSGAFQACPELRVLRLDSNKLQSLPGTLAGQLPNLLWLNVSSNQLTKAEYSTLPTTLEWLDVSHNLLESIGAGVGKSHTRTKLRVIDASSNLITALDQTAIPSTLEVLKMNHNRLEKIFPDTFSRAENLRRAELIGNQMESIPVSALRFVKFPEGKPLPEFFLGGNPFLCDCNMEWLTRTAQTSNSRALPIVMDMDGIVCRLSYSRTGTHLPMAAMKPHDFLCPYRSHCFALCHCCDFDACDCAMTCPSNCTCYHDDTWTGNVIDCARSGQTQIPARLPMDSTEVYLDGNTIPLLKSHTLIGRKNLKNLYLNSSRIETISNKSFNGLQSLENLHLENNLLTVLQGFEFDHLARLRELYLNNNNIRSISNSTFLTLKSLEILRLDGNKLLVFTVWQLSLNPYLVEIGLSSNPWTCDCKFLGQFHSWIGDNSKKVMDMRELRCTWNGTSSHGPYIRDFDNGTCSSSAGTWTLIQSGFPLDVNSLLPWIILLAISLFLIVLLVFVAVFWRENFNFFLYSHWGVRPCARVGRSSSGGGGEDEKAYDAYLIYSQKDEEFVNEKIAEELETHDNYRLCLHHRDLVNETGDFKGMMWGALESAKSLIVVVSRNFTQEWGGSMEASVLASIMSRARGSGGTYPPKPVVIIQTEGSGEDPPHHLLDFSKFKILRWTGSNDSDYFWKKLKFYLPEPSSYSSNITTNTTTISSAEHRQHHHHNPHSLKYPTTTTQGLVSRGGGGDPSEGKLWSYPNGFVALPPPKYQPSSGGLVTLPKSPPSNSTDSTAIDQNSDGGGSGTSSSYYSHNTTRGKPPGDSYLSVDGEHVYSSLDPPSPLQNHHHGSSNNSSSNSYYPPGMQGTFAFPPSNNPSTTTTMNSPSGNLKSIHLPNGYTYSPSPRPQPQWHPHPSTSTNSGNGSLPGHKSGNNTGSSRKSHNSKTGENVQTYLV